MSAGLVIGRRAPLSSARTNGARPSRRRPSHRGVDLRPASRDVEGAVGNPPLTTGCIPAPCPATVSITFDDLEDFTHGRWKLGRVVAGQHDCGSACRREMPSGNPPATRLGRDKHKRRPFAVSFSNVHHFTGFDLDGRPFGDVVANRCNAPLHLVIVEITVEGSAYAAGAVVGPENMSVCLTGWKPTLR